MLARILALALAIYPALAFAQSSPILGFPPGVFQNRAAIDAGTTPPPPSFSLTYNTGGSSSAVSGTAVNYGTLTYGSGCTRVIAASLWYPGAINSISGITVNGVAFTQIPGAFASRGGGFSVDVWESNSAISGSSGSAIVTYGSAITFTSSVALYCLVTTAPTASASNSTSGDNVTSVNATISVPTGGGAIAVTGGINGNTMTFTNATVDIDVTGGINDYYGHTTATGSVNVTATYSVADGPVLSLVSWGP
jgi:hypothetical protein